LLFALLVDFTQKRLVELKLLFIHLALCLFSFFLLNLPLQELSIFLVDVSDLALKTTFLLFVVGLVASPDLSLFVMMHLLLVFTVVLLDHLTAQKFTHLILFLAFLFHAALFKHTFTHFLL
jgi:hypothetical protein